MDSFINAVLLVTGTCLAALSFMGKAWSDAEPGRKRRLTLHSVLSIVLWGCALGFGLWKDRRASIAQGEAKREQEKAERLATQNKDQLLEADAELARSQLRAERQLSQANEQAAVLKGALSEVHQEMGVMQKRSDSREDAQIKRSFESQVTMLAAGDQKVKEIALILPLTKAARRSSESPGGLLPTFRKSECNGATGFGVTLSLGIGLGTTIHIAPGDGPTLAYPKEKPYVDAVMISNDKAPKRGTEIMLEVLKQKNFGGQLFEVDEVFPGKEVRAAPLLAYLLSGESLPVSVFAETPAISLDPVNNQKLFNKLWSAENPVMSKDCAAEASTYFAAAFDKAGLLLVLDKQNATILVPLKRVDFQERKSNYARAGFLVSAPPTFGAVPSFDDPTLLPSAISGQQ